MQLIAEAFNIANHRIITGVNSTYSAYVAPAATYAGAACSAGSVSLPTGATFGGCLDPYSSATAGFNTPSGTNNLLVGPRQLQVSAKLFF